MKGVLDPGLIRDLTEAKAALARHGIVIIRTVESELPLLLVAEARRALQSAQEKLSALGEDELDKLMEEVRAASTEAARDLKSLYTNLLARLGTEYIGDLVKDLDGMAELFRWSRISRAAEGVNAVLARWGFGPIELGGPEHISPAFKVELEERWEAAFARFRTLAERAATELREKGEEAHPSPSGKKKASEKRR